ncbi:unnamed protein product [Cunninghamella blakesleeana]
MPNRSNGYIRRRTTRWDAGPRRSNTNNTNTNTDTNNNEISLSSFIQEITIDDNNTDYNNNTDSVVVEVSDDNQATTVFNTSITIPRSVTKNNNTIVFDLHVLFSSAASKEKATHDQGLKIGNLQIIGTPVINTIHYKDIFKYQENDFNPSLSLIHWPDQYHPNNTKCTVYTLFNLPKTNDETHTLHLIKDSIIYMENWLKLRKKDHLSNITSNNNGFYGPVSVIPTNDFPFIGVFPVRYLSTHITKDAYFVVIHGHMVNYSVFQKTTPSSSSSHHHHRYYGKESTRLICFENNIFFYDRLIFDRTFCFHCKTPDCHFT